MYSSNIGAGTSRGARLLEKQALLLKGRVVDSLTSIRFRQISTEFNETLGMWNTTPPTPKGEELGVR